MQLPVGETVEVPVGPVQREPGLADAAQAADRRDHHRPAGLGVLVQCRGERGEFGLPTGEQPGRGGQLPGHGCPGRPRHPRGDGQRGVRGQDLLVQVLQGRTGIGAQFLGQPAAEFPVVRHGVGRLATAVEGQHELAGEAFVERVRLRPVGQFR